MSAPPPKESRGALIWRGKPSTGPVIALYGIITLVVMVILVTVEYLASTSSSLGAAVFPASSSFGSMIIPFPIEILTIIIIGIIFAVKAISLEFMHIRNTYELHEDGIYINSGIVNLENAFLAPIAFSDARLYRSWWMRIIGRGEIVVEGNDGRKFVMRYIRDSLSVQQLIRRTLARPPVRF